MKSRSVCLLGTVFSVVLSANPSLPVQAANLNTNAVSCQQFLAPGNGRTDEILRQPGFVMTNTDVEGTRPIICDLTRSPLIAGATSGGFYVDGDNFNGASTTCAVYSIDYTGVFLGASGFNTSAPTYDIFISLPAAQLPTYAYTHLDRDLPAHGNGRLRGITSLQ